MFGWFLDYLPGQAYPKFESRDIASELLSLHGSRPFLTAWQYAFLARVRPVGSAMSERDRIAVRRIYDSVDNLPDYVPPAESPATIAEKAAKRALGLDGPKRKKRDKDEPPRPKLKRQEAEEPCPCCRTGALLKSWNSGKGGVYFSCQNRRCVRKVRITLDTIRLWMRKNNLRNTVDCIG